MSADEERIALFLDYENLAIGARENLGGMAFDFKPVADALAERGRVVVRKAYADWLKFAEDGRMLTRHHVELTEIPQRMGSVRKNAADIKMAVDALELCFERGYITTFVLGTGDSDFTPLVHKLREHNKQVIGLGVQMSTSALLPPACDEFLFYERLEGVEVPTKRRSSSIVPRGRRGRRPQVGDVGEVEPEVESEADADAGETAESTAPSTLEEVEKLITQTLAGLERSSGSVRASSLKRAVLRKESTFSEADYGFRGFTELLRSLHDRGVLHLTDSSSPGDPDVQFPSGADLGEVGAAFELLASTIEGLSRDGNGAPLSGLKTQLRRKQPEFSEKRFGFGGFLQFAKAGVTRGVVEMAWSDEADDYLLTAVADRPTRGALATVEAEAGASVETAELTEGTAGARTENGVGRGRRGRGGRGRPRAGEFGADATAVDDVEGRGDRLDVGSIEGEQALPGIDVDPAGTPAVLADEDWPATSSLDVSDLEPDLDLDADEAVGDGAAGAPITDADRGSEAAATDTATIVDVPTGDDSDADADVAVPAQDEPAQDEPAQDEPAVAEARPEAPSAAPAEAAEPAAPAPRKARARRTKAAAAPVDEGPAPTTDGGVDAGTDAEEPAAPKRRRTTRAKATARAAGAASADPSGSSAEATDAAPKPARRKATATRRRRAGGDGDAPDETGEA